MVPSTQGGPSNDEEVAAKLSAAAAAARSGVAFDHGKTEAALFHRKKSTSKATLRRGMRCTGPRAGGGSQEEHGAGAGHDLLRRPGRHQADGIR